MQSITPEFRSECELCAAPIMVPRSITAAENATFEDTFADPPQATIFNTPYPDGSKLTGVCGRNEDGTFKASGTCARCLGASQAEYERQLLDIEVRKGLNDDLAL